MTPFSRTLFEGALAHARGKIEEHRDDPMFIQMIVADLGIEIRILSRRGDDRQVNRLVIWHDIEQRLYDALRIGIDSAVKEFIGFKQAA